MIYILYSYYIHDLPGQYKTTPGSRNTYISLHYMQQRNPRTFLVPFQTTTPRLVTGVDTGMPWYSGQIRTA